MPKNVKGKEIPGFLFVLDLDFHQAMSDRVDLWEIQWGGGGRRMGDSMALWSRTAKNPNVCTGPLARTTHSFARSTLLASIARSAVLNRSVARSLTHFRARGKVNY